MKIYDLELQNPIHTQKKKERVSGSSKKGAAQRKEIITWGECRKPKKGKESDRKERGGSII